VKTKSITVLLAAVMLTSMALLSPANAAAFPDLPPGQVYLTLSAGPTKWPASADLSGVPAGYDVANSPPSYVAWCTEFDAWIEAGPSYPVTLLSSLGISSTWNKVNYLLNNIIGDKDLDVQVALWLLLGYTQTEIDERYSGEYTGDALDMFDDANDNGDCFSPSCGEIVAVICETEGDTQDLIIELTIPCREPGYTPGFWKHNIGICIGEKNGKHSCFADGTRLDCTMLNGYLAYINANYPAPYDEYDLADAYADLNAKGPGSESIRMDMANAFNDAAGYGPYED
jgi:hypothetical protein